MTATELSTVTLTKPSGETYCFIYADEYRDETLRAVAAAARDNRLSFTWLDAARVSRMIREGELTWESLDDVG